MEEQLTNGQVATPVFMGVAFVGFCVLMAVMWRNPPYPKQLTSHSKEPFKEKVLSPPPTANLKDVEISALKDTRRVMADEISKYVDTIIGLESKNEELVNSNRLQDNILCGYKEDFQMLSATIKEQSEEIETLKHLKNSQRRLFNGSRFYNPEDHKAPIVYVCFGWNDWYMIRQANELRPSIMSKSKFELTYPGWVKMQSANRNLKNLA